MHTLGWVLWDGRFGMHALGHAYRDGFFRMDTLGCMLWDGHLGMHALGHACWDGHFEMNALGCVLWGCGSAACEKMGFLPASHQPSQRMKTTLHEGIVRTTREPTRGRSRAAACRWKGSY